MKIIQKYFDKLLQCAIPQSLRTSSPEYFARARVFLIVALTSTPLMLIFGFGYLSANCFEIAVCCFVGATVGLVSIAIFCATKRVLLASNILISAGAVVLILGSFWAKGIHAPGILWFSAVQLLAVLMFQRKTAIFWTLLFGLSAIILAFPELAGLTTQNTVSEDDFKLFKLGGALGSAILMLVIAFSGRSEQERLHAEVENKNTQLSEALNQNTSLLRMLSHDISNSLFVIELNKTLIEKGRDTEKCTSRIDKAVHNIASLIKHTREQQALLSGKKTLALKPNGLVAAVELSIDLIKERLSNKNLAISRSYSLEDDTEVLADDVSLVNSVLCNVLSNAVKFSPPHSLIEIQIDSRSGNEVCLIIQDHGVGMPQEILSNLFEFSSSTSRPGTEGEAGTGFGMPLVQTYMNCYGGKIQVESKPQDNGSTDHGTKVILTFQKHHHTPRMIHPIAA